MYDEPGPAKDAGTYDDLSMFLKRTQERMERESAEADQAEAHAKMARHRAEQTRAVYNQLCKTHESFANAPVYPTPPTDGSLASVAFPTPPGGWQVRQ